MLHHFRTLRFRLALLYLTVFGLILIALSGFILQSMERYLRDDFDNRLREHAESMTATIIERSGRPVDPDAPSTNRPRLRPYRLQGYFFQLVAGDPDHPDVLEKSQSLEELSLPINEKALSVRGTTNPDVQTLDASLGRDLTGQRVEMRMLTIYRDEEDIDPYFLQIASSLGPTLGVIHALRRLILLVVPVGLGVAALASWLMARRSLAPIGVIAREARQFTAAHLDRRIDVPPGNDEVAEMVVVINEMLDRLETAFRGQERFIADVSHELQTPLSVLLAEGQVFHQHPRTIEEYQAFVHGFEDELRQLARLIDSLLTLARAEAGAPFSEPLSVSLNEIVLDAVQGCEPTAKSRSVRLIPILAPPAQDGREAVVAGDPQLLRSLTENLIRNAVRYSPPEQAVEIMVELNGRHVMLKVSDHGPGIPAEHIDRVFERFYRVPDVERTPQGSGLGLAIAKQVATLHRGTITAANRSEGGCEFVVRLPLQGSVGR